MKLLYLLLAAILGTASLWVWHPDDVSTQISDEALTSRNIIDERKAFKQEMLIISRWDDEREKLNQLIEKEERREKEEAENRLAKKIAKALCACKETR